MFFWSVCKNNLVCASVCWSIASWRQQTGVCVRAELKRLQSLKNRILCYRPRAEGFHRKRQPILSLERMQGNENGFRLYPKDSSAEVVPGEVWRGICNGRPANSTPGEDLRETTRSWPGAVHKHFHLSLGLFTLAGFTDELGGYIASNWASRKSVLGSALDPLADKILISVFYISLPYAQLIPGLFVWLVIIRDVDLIAAVSYVRYKTVPPPSCVVCMQVNTAIQLFLVAASLASSVFHFRQSAPADPTVIHTIASYSYCHYGMRTHAVLNGTK
uniref:cardiolipin synthase (CMP-forming) n=1 Tax=Salmo trutta TaxID=8032 RepID=A0A674C1P5_SALTR